MQYCDLWFFYEGSQCVDGNQDIGQAHQQVYGESYASMCGEDANCDSGKFVECCVDIDVFERNVVVGDELNSETLFIPDNAKEVHLVCQTTRSKHKPCQPTNNINSQSWLLKIIFPIIIAVAVILALTVCWLIWKLRRKTMPSDDETVKTCDDEDPSVICNEGSLVTSSSDNLESGITSNM
jgi:hypothetical protein